MKMKNFLIAVLLGFLIGIIYIFMLAFIITPLLFLFKNGFIGLMLGTINITDFIRNVLGRSMGMFYKLDSYSITIIIVQVILFFSVCFIAYKFLSKVLNVFFEKEKDVQLFYKVVYIILFFVPEILILVSLFFKFPVMRTIIIICSIVTIVMTLAMIIIRIILPDLMEIQNTDSFMEEGGVIKR